MDLNKIFQTIARQHGVTPQEVEADMKAALQGADLKKLGGAKALSMEEFLALCADHIIARSGK